MVEGGAVSLAVPEAHLAILSLAFKICVLYFQEKWSWLFSIIRPSMRPSSFFVYGTFGICVLLGYYGRLLASVTPNRKTAQLARTLRASHH